MIGGPGDDGAWGTSSHYKKIEEKTWEEVVVLSEPLTQQAILHPTDVRERKKRHFRLLLPVKKHLLSEQRANIADKGGKTLRKLHRRICVWPALVRYDTRKKNWRKRKKRKTSLIETTENLLVQKEESFCHYPKHCQTTVEETLWA